MLARILLQTSQNSSRGRFLVGASTTRRLAYRRCLTSQADGNETPSASAASSALDDWIPPNRPLIGDQQPYHDTKMPSAVSAAVVHVDDEEEELRILQEEIDRLEQDEKSHSSHQQDQDTGGTATSLSSSDVDEEEELRLLQQEIDKLDQKEKQKKETSKPLQTIVDEDTSIDWLKTRRRVMGGGDETNNSNTLTATIPGEARHRDLFEVEDIHHTLLKKEEIATILNALGGEDIKVIYDDPNNRRMGGAMGMILATASRQSQMRILADTLVRQMRRRKLQEVDVFGAVQGPEGKEDSDWMVVDCRNFIVHILGEKTRKALNLEDLWSGKDPLHQVAWYNEDEVDDYVAAYPVPEDYGAPMFDWDETYRELQKNRWTAPHKPVVKKPPTKRRKR